ncbi:MAG: LysR family transcriptional regulator [Pseudomonadota bacterium]
MNWQAISFDWNQVRAFLATAEEGSLSAAARALGQTQPTLSRQVAALEDELGVTLFERAGRAMALTSAGIELLEHVRAMADAATRVSLSASGQSQDVSGHVIITATNVMATLHLPPILKKIRQAAPQVELEIITSNEVRDLTRREADIAIRHGRPEQPDLIAKLIGETQAHLYASTDYIQSLGPIRTLSDLNEAEFIGFDRFFSLRTVLAEAGIDVTKRNFKLNTPSGTVLWELVAQGLGISILTKDVETAYPKVKPILPKAFERSVPLWLTTHRELHTSRRIRIVYDILSEELARTARATGW